MYSALRPSKVPLMPSEREREVLGEGVQLATFLGLYLGFSRHKTLTISNHFLRRHWVVLAHFRGTYNLSSERETLPPPTISGKGFRILPNWAKLEPLRCMVTQSVEDNLNVNPYLGLRKTKLEPSTINDTGTGRSFTVHLVECSY